MTFALSNHAAVRVQQRGVPHRLPVGGACTVLRMTQDRLNDPDLAASLGADRERLRGLSIVWSQRTGEIVTVLRPRRGPAGRRYRRGGH